MLCFFFFVRTKSSLTLHIVILHKGLAGCEFSKKKTVSYNNYYIVTRLKKETIIFYFLFFIQYSKSTYVVQYIYIHTYIEPFEGSIDKHPTSFSFAFSLDSTKGVTRRSIYRYVWMYCTYNVKCKRRGCRGQCALTFLYVCTIPSVCIVQLHR